PGARRLGRGRRPARRDVGTVVALRSGPPPPRRLLPAPAVGRRRGPRRQPPRPAPRAAGRLQGLLRVRRRRVRPPLRPGRPGHGLGRPLLELAPLNPTTGGFRAQVRQGSSICTLGTRVPTWISTRLT